jgi:hypothetical protein
MESPLNAPDPPASPIAASTDFPRALAVFSVIVGVMYLLFSLQSSAPDYVSNVALVGILLAALLAARWAGGLTAALIHEGVKGALLLGAAVGIVAWVGSLLHPETPPREGVIWYVMGYAQFGMLFGALFGAMERTEARHAVVPSNAAWVVLALTVAACGKEFFGPWVGGGVGTTALALAIGAAWRDRRPVDTVADSNLRRDTPFNKILWGGLAGMFYGLFTSPFLSMIGLEKVRNDAGRPEAYWLLVIFFGALLGTVLKVARERRSLGILSAGSGG